MRNRLLRITTYFGMLGGLLVLGAFLLYASVHYPKIAESPVAFSTAAGISWFVLTVFVLNKAHTTEIE